MLKHYVEYITPSLFMADTSVVEVPSRIPQEVKVADRTVGFRFFDREETIVDGETLKGKNKNYSGWHYTNGKLLTLEEVKKTMPDKKILISNMESNGWNKVVQLSCGQIYPLYEGDVIL